jgi:hypothetical protein
VCLDVGVHAMAAQRLVFRMLELRAPEEGEARERQACGYGRQGAGRGAAELHREQQHGGRDERDAADTHSAPQARTEALGANTKTLRSFSVPSRISDVPRRSLSASTRSS